MLDYCTGAYRLNSCLRPHCPYRPRLLVTGWLKEQRAGVEHARNDGLHERPLLLWTLSGRSRDVRLTARGAFLSTG